MQAQSGNNPILEMKYDRFQTIGHCHWIVFQVSLGEADGSSGSPWAPGDYEFWSPVVPDAEPQWKPL